METKKSIIFQLEEPLKEAAESKLKSIGMSMSEYLRRCLMSLTKDGSTAHVTDMVGKLISESANLKKSDSL